MNAFKFLFLDYLFAVATLRRKFFLDTENENKKHLLSVYDLFYFT